MLILRPSATEVEDTDHLDKGSMATGRQMESRGTMDAPNTYEKVSVGEQLTQYLAPDVISYRRGEGGKLLPYLEGHEVLTLLNTIFGWNRWNSKVVKTDLDYATETSVGKWSVGMAVTVQLTVLWEDKGLTREAVHQDIGYGTMDNAPGRGKALEKCRKEGMTDGIKRAARQFGNATGGCLYNTEYRDRVKKVKGPAERINFVEEELLRKPMKRVKALYQLGGHCTSLSREPTATSTSNHHEQITVSKVSDQLKLEWEKCETLDRLC